MFCPKCGTNVDDSFNFCVNCGFNLADIRKTVGNGFGNALIAENAMPVVNTFKEERKNDNIYGFNGTQESFNEICNTFLYYNEDIEQTVKFMAFVKNSAEYSGIDIYSTGWTEDMLDMLIASQDNNMLKKCFALIPEKSNSIYEEIDCFAENIGDFVVKVIWGKNFYLRLFNADKFYCIYVTDMQKVANLNEKKSQSNNQNYISKLEQEIKEIEGQYADEQNIENLIAGYIEILDIDHFQVDMNNNILQYSSWIDAVYVRFLNKLYEKYNLSAFDNLYPTEEQKNKFRTIIQGKLKQEYGNFFANLMLVQKSAEKCLSLIKNIESLNGSFSTTELLKKGALTLGLMAISGPIGVLNGVREAYNYNEKDNKVKELEQELYKEQYVFFEELEKTKDVAMQVAVMNCNEMRELGKNILAAALKNVVDKSLEHSLEIKSLREYFN